MDDGQPSKSLILSPSITSPGLLDVPRAAFRALAIAEVMYAILEDLCWEDGDKATLASLARTCKLFKEPALDALYQDLDSLDELLWCMTSDVCVINQKSLVLRRPMQSRERDTLQRYAARVKALTVQPYDIKIHSDIIHAVCMIQVSLDQALCTNLHTLGWTTTEERYLPLLPCLISPALLHLDIPVQCALRPCMPTIPSLATLTITGYSPTPVNLGFLGEWSHLTFLNCSRVPLGKETQAKCAFRGNLHQLSLMVTGRDDTSQSPIAHQDADMHSFANLSRLQLYSVGGIKFINTFLSTWKVKEIMELHVSVLADSSKEDLVSFFQFFGQLHPRGQLQSFTVDRIISRRQVSYLEMSVLHPLFQFHDLTNMSITVVSFNMNNHDLEELALAFPKLEYLRILTFPRGGKPLNTLHGLVSLLRHCPKLLEATISLDASSIPVDCPRVPHTLLNHLRCINSPVNDVVEVSVFLSDIIPCATVLSNDSAKWQEVARWVDVLRAGKGTGAKEAQGMWGQ